MFTRSAATKVFTEEKATTTSTPSTTIRYFVIFLNFFTHLLPFLCTTFVSNKDWYVFYSIITSVFCKNIVAGRPLLCNNLLTCISSQETVYMSTISLMLVCLPANSFIILWFTFSRHLNKWQLLHFNMFSVMIFGNKQSCYVALDNQWGFNINIFILDFFFRVFTDLCVFRECLQTRYN